MSARARFLAKHAALVAAALLVLLVPWPGVERAYGACFRGLGRALFAILGADSVQILPASPSEGMHNDTHLAVSADPRGPAAPGYACSSWFLGYVPSAVFLALWAGSPLPARVRWRSLVLGLALVQVFVYLRVAILLLHGTLTSGAGAGASWKTRVTETLLEIQFDPTVYVSVPIVVWALVAFRPAYWRIVEPVRATA